MPTRRTLFRSGLALATALLLGSAAQAQSYPERNITLIVPFAPGGVTDLTARIYADALAQELGQPVVVDNRAGAGGTTGGGMVASADPDGYTLLWSGSSLLSLAPLLYPDLSYDISTAYQPISRIMTHTLILAANPELPANTVEEYVAYAKENPDALNYGSPGVGTIHHLTMELFKARAEFEALHIPYQGNGPASADLLAGNIQTMFMGMPLAVPYAGDTSLKFLAVTSPERDPAFPDVPTFSEAGYPALEVAQSWYGVLAPAGLPADVLEILSAASNRAAESEMVMSAASESGMTTVVEQPQDFADAIASTAQTWADLVEQTGVELQ